MSEAAKVTSIDAIRAFRESLCSFGEDCRAGLTSVDMEVNRAQQWLMRDRVLFWQMEWKRRNQDLSTARAELFRRKLSSVSDEPPDVGEKKELVRVAERRLREAEEKIAAVKRWVNLLQQAISQYHGKSRPLGDKLDSGLPHALNLLDNMTAALDAYIAMAPPPAPDLGPASAAEAPAADSAPKESAT
jgi:hypothetical protein